MTYAPCMLLAASVSKRDLQVLGLTVDGYSGDALHTPKHSPLATCIGPDVLQHSTNIGNNKTHTLIQSKQSTLNMVRATPLQSFGAATS